MRARLRCRSSGRCSCDGGWRWCGASYGTHETSDTQSLVASSPLAVVPLIRARQGSSRGVGEGEGHIRLNGTASGPKEGDLGGGPSSSWSWISMHVATSSFARSATLLCAFALLSCTASGDETGRAEAALTTVDAGAPASLFAGGAGTEASPYQVANCAQPQALQTALYSYFVFTADIDCTSFDAGDGKGFRPIGSDAQEFGGRVNGVQITC